MNYDLDQEREDSRRIRELQSMNEDIENNSIMANTKDCRPSNTEQSIFKNATIAEKQGETLVINKSKEQQDVAKRTLQERHSQHKNKVQNRKLQTMSTNGMTLHTMRSTSDHLGSGIIKTVILPNEEMNRLAVEAEEL